MKYLWLLLAVCLTCIILYNSSLPAEDSGRLSAWAADLLYGAALALNITLEGDVEHLLRKLAHFCEFALLGWLWCRVFASFRISARTSAGYILLFCLLTAAADEYVQLFSPGRSSQVRDVLLDFSGSLCAWLWHRIWQWSS